MAGTNFAFSTNVPQQAQKISATQVPIMNNFEAINEWANVNHVGFGDAINYGKHNLTTLVQVPGNTDPTTLSTEMSLYCKSVSNDTNGYELFYRYPNSGAIGQLTNVSGPSGGAGNGYAYINSGLLIKWGTFTINSVPTTVNFPTGGSIPAFATSVYILMFSPNITGNIATNGIIPNNITTTSFDCQYSSTITATQYIQWFALGI